MRLHTLRIPCINLAASELTYSTLLERPKAFGDVAQGFIGFTLDNVTLLLERSEPGDFEAGRYLGFSLEVPDIHVFYERLRTQIKFTSPPEVQPWGGVMTHVTDNNGNTLSLVQITPHL